MARRQAGFYPPVDLIGASALGENELIVSSCEFCVSVVGRRPVADWDVLQRCKHPGADIIVAKYFGIDEWKVAQERRKHGNFDSCVRCLSRRYRRSVHTLAAKYGNKPPAQHTVKSK